MHIRLHVAFKRLGAAWGNRNRAGGGTGAWRGTTCMRFCARRTHLGQMTKLA